MRDYFIALFKKNLPAVALSRDNIDTAIKMFMNAAMIAHKSGQPDPFPWLSEACAFCLANDIETMAMEEAGEKPVVNEA